MKYANALAIGGATMVAAAMAITATASDGRPVKPVIVTAEESDVVTRQVTFADLNLASNDGKRALNGRIGSAVKEVCDDAVGHDDTWLYHYCSIGAWQDARPQMARAVERARQIAMTGTSSITAAAAITFSVRH